MVSYYDDPGSSNFVQWRLRRASAFASIDLREVLPVIGITNGGGHPGAIGFRRPKSEVQDITAMTKEFAEKVSAMCK
jgi:nanoRNase/pAp phosphatase (c-di-AMP/oligoRNAs hydrolase)